MIDNSNTTTTNDNNYNDNSNDSTMNNRYLSRPNFKTKKVQVSVDVVELNQSVCLFNNFKYLLRCNNMSCNEYNWFNTMIKV